MSTMAATSASSEESKRENIHSSYSLILAEKKTGTNKCRLKVSGTQVSLCSVLQHPGHFVIALCLVLSTICHSSQAADDSIYLYEDDLYDSLYYDDNYNNDNVYYEKGNHNVGQHQSGTELIKLRYRAYMNN